jgi:glycosyltransferase involved in cell wall biosynthesis
MVFLSIVIPAYNSEKTILLLLQSIAKSQKVDFSEIEVVVVDDASADATAEVGMSFFRTSQVRSTCASGTKVVVLRNQWEYSKRQCLPAVAFKLIRLKKNQGPAKARNIGVKHAKGKVVLFLDADVVLYKDTLFEIIRSFKNDPDLYALTGVWDKTQKSNKFFPKFKALRDWSYWINERDPKNYYYLFSTRVAAIKKDLFLRLGGFDTTYKHALVEDMELTYRIAKRYAVVFNPRAIVHHEFEDFFPIAKKYFWRSFYWSKIYRERKKFDPVATTGKEAATTVSAGGVVLFTAVLLLSYLGNLGDPSTSLGTGLSKIALIGLIVVGVIHLFGVRKFLFFVSKEEGVVFAVKSFFVGIILYLVILAGAGASLIKK